MPHVNKKKTNSEKRKFGSIKKKLRLERTMNGLEKPFRKSDPKSRKNNNNQN